jgi:hypothetical protein
VVMHGHRHIDWIGACRAIKIVSAPSPVMGAADDAPTHFHIHTLRAGLDGRLRLLPPERIEIAGNLDPLKREFSWIRLETFGNSRPKSSNVGLQRLLAMRKARIWRVFLIEERKFSENKTAWLEREDSNLRMVEMKIHRLAA